MSDGDEMLGEGFSDGKFGEELMQKSVCCRLMEAGEKAPR